MKRMASSRRKNCSLADAKAHFAECVRAAERGQVTVLTRHGRPVARLMPIESGEVREPQSEYEAHPVTLAEGLEVRKQALLRLLEREIWPQIPEEMIGKAPSKQEREEILGLGEAKA
jgi:prevent-host-death family protein